MTENYFSQFKPIDEVLRETINEEKEKGNCIYSVSFEIKVSKTGTPDGEVGLKTIALKVDKPNMAF